MLILHILLDLHHMFRVHERMGCNLISMVARVNRDYTEAVDRADISVQNISAQNFTRTISWLLTIFSQIRIVLLPLLFKLQYSIRSILFRDTRMERNLI